jgi:transposase-like protein
VGGTSGRKKKDAIAALLTQRNVEEAARAAGIGTRTLLRWLKIPEFDAAYRQARRAAFGQTIARLQQGSSPAATTLMKLMLDPATPPSTRARCSEAIISFSSKAIELEDIEARLAALEQATEAPKKSR